VSNRPITVAIVGAGHRSVVYARYALQHPERMKVVAIADPVEHRRRTVGDAHAIPEEMRFRSYEDLAERRVADAVINGTMDPLHYPSAMPLLRAGYHMLLEKPIAQREEEVRELIATAQANGCTVMICHVLRYTAFWSALHDIIAAGRLGRVINVDHRENVAYWHQTHSFVRGNWGNAAASAPMILAKCCHDMDILHWNLGAPVRRLSAFGHLSHFRADQAPPGAPERCTDGCPSQDECPYYAPRLYLRPDTGWPVSVISLDLSMEGRLKALREGPYGRCVYHCDNDVVDHHVVNVEFEGDATLTFTMQGHSHDNVRTMRYDGTRATLRASEAAHEIAIHDHLTGNREVITPAVAQGGHGGGDTGVMNAFVAALRGTAGGGLSPLTSARASLESHLMAFAAEEARVEGTMIDMAAYRERVEREAGAC
jgi:predicted dehydrogenase